MNEKQLISIVVPVFNETEVIEVFYKRCKSVFNSLDSFICEIIFVDDGSKDDSYKKMIRLADLDQNVKIIKFSRNFGHQIAITAGMDVASGNAVVIIDADLQDPPEVIKDFIRKWEEGYDVVYGVREKREGENRMKLFTASVFYRILKVFTKIDIPVDTGDFRLLSRRAVLHLRELREHDRFVRGLVSWIGFKQTAVHYHRDMRYAGETKFPYKMMVKFAIDGITSFSSVPLKLATILGYITSIFAFFYACIVFIQKALGITVQGWATIMVGILFLGGIQLICLGIMGEYVARIFNQIKQRPMYIVDEVYSGAGRTNDFFSEPQINDRRKFSG
jgi:glycosyltransferase involved in cell wall biosynthesis